MQSDLIPLKEAQARLHCGAKFLRRLIREGRIEVVRINCRLIFVQRASLESYERAARSWRFRPQLPQVTASAAP